MNATLFPPNSSLFLGDLSKFCTEADLEKIFSPYGDINQIRIMRNTNTGKALSYGFISFMNNECAANAMENLNGISLHGRSMRIGWAAHNLKTHKTEEPAIINSVYVRFITPKTSEYVTEEVIHRAFDQFGSVVDVSIKQSAVDQRSGRQSGYGFVHFSADHAGILAAFDALSRMNNNTYDGVTYSVEPSKNLLRQMDEMNLGVGGRGLRSTQPGVMSTSMPAPLQHQPQPSLYGRGAPLQSRMEPPYRPLQPQGRDDYQQMSKLYQQPSHTPHHQQMLNHGRNVQGMYPSAASRYDGSQTYGASPHYQQQTPFEPHVHRYAPQHNSHATGVQQQSYGRHLPQQERVFGGATQPSGFRPAPSVLGNTEDLYGRQHSYTQPSDSPSLSVLISGQGLGSSVGTQGPSPRAVNQTMSSSPGTVGGHVRNSSRDLDFASAVLAPADEYVSSYVIEKPLIDERFFDAPSKDPVPSSFSYGPNGSPPAFQEKHFVPSTEQQHTAHGTYNNDRRVGMSSNSQSLYAHLPSGSARPPHAGQPQPSRRPVAVTDLEIGRSRSMSSAGLPTFSTNATTDCEGGFFKSANSSFTEGAHSRFAHLNSFGDYPSNSQSNLLSQGADNWVGISDQHSPLTQEALQNHQPPRYPNHTPLASSMRKYSMQSVTTNGGEEEVTELVEDDFTVTAALTSTHETATSQDSLFNYMDSNASSFALPSPPYSSSYTVHNHSGGSVGLSFSPKDTGVDKLSNGFVPHQQNGSEMDDVISKAEQLSLLNADSGSNSARSSVSEEKKPSPKSRQLPVTHFFKPVTGNKSKGTVS